MRKLVFSIVLLPILAFSYELNFNKSFSKVVSPDILSTNVTVIVEKQDESSVNEQIEKFNSFIKSVKYVTIKNGNYRLSPRYNYRNDIQEFKGFSGYLRYVIQSKEAKDINKFISELISIKDKAKSTDIKLDISAIVWEVSPTLQDKSFDELRFEAISWVENYSNSLASEFSKKCEVKNINIDGFISNMPMLRYDSVATSKAQILNESVTNVTPMSSEQNITINPRFILECR